MYPETRYEISYFVCSQIHSITQSNYIPWSRTILMIDVQYGHFCLASKDVGMVTA